VSVEEFGFSLGASAGVDVFTEGGKVAVGGAVVEIHVFGFLFSVSVSVSLAVPRLLDANSLSEFADVNKKSKKIFSPRQTIFLYTGAKSAEPHEC
jgi:hypothetical protein